jgi:Major Facilitator Superfamily
MRTRTPILARPSLSLTRILALLPTLPATSAWSTNSPHKLSEMQTHRKFIAKSPLSSVFTRRKTGSGIQSASTKSIAMSSTSSAHDMGSQQSDSAHADSSTLNFNWSIAALLISAFLNLLGFTMAGPITPALGQHFGLTVGASFGSLTSAYPLGMLFGLFLWPSLSDRWGRPPVITFTLLGTGLGLAAQAYIVATNRSLWMFLVSRVITGSFAGSSPVSKAYLADVSNMQQTRRTRCASRRRPFPALSLRRKFRFS